jgi:hypothetical protein
MLSGISGRVLPRSRARAREKLVVAEYVLGRPAAGRVEEAREHLEQPALGDALDVALLRCGDVHEVLERDRRGHRQVGQRRLFARRFGWHDAPFGTR